MSDPGHRERVVHVAPREAQPASRAPRTSWVRTAAAVALAIAVLVVAVGVGLALGDRRQAGEPSGSAPTDAPAVAQATPTGTAAPPATSLAPPAGTSVSAASAVPSPSPVALTPVAALPGVAVGSLGAVRGDVVFAARIVGDGWGVHELWVIPLAGGAPRVVLRYPRTWATDAWPQRYLSPDGRRYAFEVERGGIHRIAVADLTTGAVSLVRTDDSTAHDRLPAWDPTGSRLAFVRIDGDVSARRDGGLWVVGTDGSGLKRLVAGTASLTYIHQWTPDGRAVAFYQGTGYDVVDVATGARITMQSVVSADASWRAASPRLIAHGDGEVQTIFAADAPDGPRATVVRGASQREHVGYPRWRPGTDEFLYLRSLDGQSELRARSLAGGERTLTTRRAISPTWTTDGSSVVYIHSEEVALPSPSPCPTGAAVCPRGPSAALVTTELRIVSADGSGDRSLFRVAPAGDPGTPGWCVCNDGLAVRRY